MGNETTYENENCQMENGKYSDIFIFHEKRERKISISFEINFEGEIEIKLQQQRASEMSRKTKRNVIVCSDYDITNSQIATFSSSCSILFDKSEYKKAITVINSMPAELIRTEIDSVKCLGNYVLYQLTRPSSCYVL